MQVIVKTLRRSVLAGLLLLSIVSVQAQSTDLYTTHDVLGIPESVRLQNLTQQYQDLNRCSAAALAIQLSYFNTGDYQEIIRKLNPYGSDVSVRIEEMARAAEDYGLKAIVRRGGTLDLLRQLVAGGFPVLVENAYVDGPDPFEDWMSHNRVLMGYDDRIQAFYFFDPLLGPGDDRRGRAMSYTEVDAMWRQFNRDYLVVYQEFDEPRLQAIMDKQWDADYNAQWTLVQAQFEIYDGEPDAFSYLNRGWAQVQLEQYEAAAEAFDIALEMGIPWRMLWYEFGLFEAYLAMGRYDDVLAQVNQVLRTTDGVEEMYYYMGLAYQGKGETQQAIDAYQKALLRNKYFAAAQTALDALQPPDETDTDDA